VNLLNGQIGIRTAVQVQKLPEWGRVPTCTEVPAAWRTSAG